MGNTTSSHPCFITFTEEEYNRYMNHLRLNQVYIEYKIKLEKRHNKYLDTIKEYLPITQTNRNASEDVTLFSGA